MKPCHPAKPWGPKEFFMGVGYPTHNLEGYIPYPESLVIPSKPPPMERAAEDQPFCLVHDKHPYDPREWIYITSVFPSCFPVKGTRGLGQENCSGF